MSRKIFNSLKSKKTNGWREIKISNVIRVRVRNDDGTEAEDPAEVYIYDDIGKSPWSDRGISATDFANALKEIPRTSNINFRINSRGGDVHEGMTMHNLIAEWPNKTVAIIDGVAASTASWIPMACDEIHMPETAQMFIHDAMCYTAGNAAQLRKDADDLDTTSDQIAQMYADKSGKSLKDMRKRMQDETLMTGKEAKALGLVDVLTSKKPVHNFSTEEMSSMKEQLALMRNSAPKPGEGQPITKKNDDTIMNRKQMEALLNRLGIKSDNTATDADLLALINAIPAPKTEPDPAKPANAGDAKYAELENKIKSLTESDNAAKKLRIENAVQKHIDDDKVPVTQKNDWVTKAMADETVLTMLDGLPSKAPGGDPLPKLVEVTNESFDTIQKYVLDNGPRLTNKFVGGNSGRITVDKKVIHDIHTRAIAVANMLAKHRNMLISMFNTNTIDPELQRTVILGDLVRAYAKRILPLRAFCSNIGTIPLEGNDKVAVPYFDLQTAASTDWVAATGYVTGDTASAMREVTINKRKYQGMAFTSYELRRQPYQNWQQLALMNAEKLGVDVNTDVLSVVTAANYGAAVKVIPAAAFAADDIADLSVSADDLNWPDEGRSLVLGSAYKGSLLKDPAYKYFMNAGDTDAQRKGKIKDAYGFEDIYTLPTANLPQNGEHLRGFITHKSAAMVGCAPIVPGPAVRAQMVQYEIAVDPINDVAVEYRMFGDAQKDKTNEIVESNYGYAKVRETALGRITDQ